MNKILDANPGASSLGPNFFENGFHADLSPDGTLLAYSSCQFGTEYEFAVEGSLEQIGAEWYERGKFNYEIAVAQLDRSNQTRLTHNQTLDHFPVWSPDGARIAFVSNMTTHAGFRTGQQRVYTMAADGSDVQVLTDQIDEVAVAPPVWSPDGERLAFVVNEGELYLTEDRSVYTVRADGSELVKIGQATIPPTWSPDSRHLAFATNDRHTNDGQESTIHTARFDGTDLRPVPVSQLGDARLSISQISWSPVSRAARRCTTAAEELCTTGTMRKD